ncbi:acyltransferase [Paenibacillus oryzisoli]|uniref:acyltransferase n=1 Tax=Paenibacillus oryzisoli TaxID=1850517 RepID=UPI003D28F4F4
MAAKPKLTEIDYLRALAIIAVLVIHGTAAATLLPSGSVSQAVFFLINKASLFTVPLFIWISGLVLFYTYGDRWKPGMAREFWWKRLRKIAVPYVLWSLFYYVWNQWIYHGTVRFDLWYFVKLLLSGNASYHLYYMVIILQFYAVFPLLMGLVKAHPWMQKALIPLGLGIQAAAYVCHHWVHPLPEYDSLLLGYSTYFCFGAYAGLRYGAVAAWAKRRHAWVRAAAVLAGVLFAGGLLLQQRGRVALSSAWYELDLVLYAMAVPMACLPAARALAARTGLVAKGGAALGAASFGVYLAHPAILTLWDRLAPEPDAQRWLYSAHTVAAILVGLAGAYALARVYASAMRKAARR